MTAIKKKINLKLILTILLIAILIILALFLTTSILGRAYDKTNVTYKYIRISDGNNVDDVSKLLDDKGIIDNESTFKFLSSITLRSRKYKAGNYYLSPSMDFNEISHTLIKGISTNSGFTIPAGYDLKQIASALEQAGYVDSKEFLNISKTVDFSSFDFIDTKVEKSKQLEGFLLPKTYKVDADANEIMIITTMLDSFDNVFTDEYKARAAELGLSVRDIVIIASVIEKETVISKEKEEISAVIHNRLNMGLSFEGGFPKNPICCPSEESIKAALYPEDNENIYYVLNSGLDGTHVFTSDHTEYKKLRKEYKQAIKEKDSEK